MKSNLLTTRAGDCRKFQKRLLAWYDGSRRDLPWRGASNPYHVWLSEVMLQQTRVAVVLERYQRFLVRFPSVEKLAAAREASVLAEWSGLGYYRRARMLHRAAKQVVRDYGGNFPSTAAELQALPGIGRYTAAAVASIAFGEAVASVDGNVERVIGRVLGMNVSGAGLQQQAEQLLSGARPGDFNQAMMDLGATLCLPRKPLCLGCPVFGFCVSRGELGAPVRQLRKKKEVHYILDLRNGSVLLVKRSSRSSLMPGMWELPEIPGANGHGAPIIQLRHSITMTDYVVKVRPAVMPSPTGAHPSGQWIRKDRITKLPLTGLARKILKKAEVI